MQIQSRLTQPKVVVSALMDGATDHRLEPSTGLRTDLFLRAQEQHQDLLITNHVERGGGAYSTKKILKAATPLWAPALVLGGLAAGVAFFSPAIGLGVAALGTAALSRGPLGKVGGFLKGVKSVLKHQKVFGDRSTGTTTYSGQTRSDAPALESAPKTLGHTVRHNMNTYPSAKHVVYVGGHGKGFHELAGHTLAQWREDYGQAKPADLMVLDACMMANIEGLADIQAVANTAVVSREPMRVDNPLSEAVSRLTEQPWKNTAQWVVSEVADHEGVDTLCAIDMESLRSTLLPAVGALGEALAEESMDLVLDCVERSEEVDSRHLGFRDLGNFLQNLSEADLKASSLAKVKAAKRALDKTQLAVEGGGLSFAPFPDREGSKNRDSLSMPKAWKRFLGKLQAARSTS